MKILSNSSVYSKQLQTYNPAKNSRTSAMLKLSNIMSSMLSYLTFKSNHQIVAFKQSNKSPLWHNNLEKTSSKILNYNP